MFEFFRYDGRKRIKGGLVLSLGMATLAAMVIWVYPSFRETFDEDELLEAYPSELIQLFDVETMGSLEGFLAFEFYVFGWVILLGLYFAYSAASVIADDVEHGRIDTLLAMPVSRTRLLTEKFAALGVPIVLVNVLLVPVVLVGGVIIEEPLSVADVFAVHLLSIPYLFACGGIGICCSVAFDRVSVAQRVALGATFALYLLESVLRDTAYGMIGGVSPMRYFDPNGILLHGSYDVAGAVILSALTGLLLGLSSLWFRRKDI
jgi:ABC-2 type transport system permease protein